SISERTFSLTSARYPPSRSKRADPLALPVMGEPGLRPLTSPTKRMYAWLRPALSSTPSNVQVRFRSTTSFLPLPLAPRNIIGLAFQVSRGLSVRLGRARQVDW